MNDDDWIARCAGRLEAEWPRIPREQRLEVARDLLKEDVWRSRSPEDAAEGWLRQGIPEHTRSSA
jgi:hypothetical protein